MKCESCQFETDPEQLFQGQCLGCIGKQNTTFRLMLAHVIMAIINGQSSRHPALGKCYNQDFGEAFVNHLKDGLAGVKTESVPPATPAQANNPKCKCGAHMNGMWVWDDDQVTDHAFNVFNCDYCGRILKIMVTDNDRQTWLEMEA